MNGEPLLGLWTLIKKESCIRELVKDKVHSRDNGDFSVTTLGFPSFRLSYNWTWKPYLESYLDIICENWSSEVRAQSGLRDKRKWPLLMVLFLFLSSSLSLSLILLLFSQKGLT
jgi:hypothetical protein